VEQPSDQQHATRAEALIRHAGLFAGILIALILALGASVVIITVRQLAPSQDANGAARSIWRVLLLALGSGVFASTLVEFAKRMLPLRAWFNTRAVAAQFGLMPSAEYYFGGRIEEVSAFLSSRFRQLVDERARQLASPTPESWGLWEVFARKYLMLDDANAPPDAAPASIAKFEQILDVFQARTSAQWVLLLRGGAAVTSSLLAGTAAVATDNRPAVIAGVFIFGLVIGGPLAWATRDLIRVVEVKGRY
jgi:hypothetical protein